LYLSGSVVAGALLAALLLLWLFQDWHFPFLEMVETTVDSRDGKAKSERRWQAGPRPGEPELVKLQCPEDIVVDNESIHAFHIRVQRQDFQGKLHVQIRAIPDDIGVLPKGDLFDNRTAKLWREVSQLRVAACSQYTFTTPVEPGQEEAVFPNVSLPLTPTTKHFPYLSRGVRSLPVVALTKLDNDSAPPKEIGWGEVRMDLRWGR
jgi:hypothetical protein